MALMSFRLYIPLWQNKVCTDSTAAESSTHYGDCCYRLTHRKQGKSAPPQIPMISNAEPVFVKRPSLSIASGQIDGHMREWAKLKRMIKIMETVPA